uniref:NADPH-dependent 7-cyano-7-deazaguanine reductase QueF n=1 Tax=Candidatus Scatousia sp. TaxID=3085663 RepID=UPI004029E6ED
MQNKTDEIAGKFLGKKVSGCDEYNPDLLVAVPRAENRERYGIKISKLPFVGWDVWHAYEFSAMTKNGLPVTKVLKLRYRSDNDFLVESKSLKLYLNSFNMSRFGKSTDECLQICKELIEKDLSCKLQTEVDVAFLNLNKVEIFSDFVNIMNFVEESSLTIDNFKESPDLLEVEESSLTREYFLKFESLRSNCRVTHQPDFGDAFIYYKSDKHIKEDSLVKYLCSFRSEYHFHEECCEMIFKRLYDLLGGNSELFVCALYTRRGGIDICPVRWSKNCSINPADSLIDLSTFARCGIKQ